jgi:hypothetical protein
MSKFKIKSDNFLDLYNNGTNYLMSEIGAGDVCMCNSVDITEDIQYKDILSGNDTHVCKDSKCSNGILMFDFMTEMSKDKLIAGAQKNVKRPVRKIENRSPKFNEIESTLNKKAELLKNIAEYVANTLPKSPLTYSGNDIYRIILSSPYKDINLNTNDIENIIALAAEFYKNKTVNHSLFSTINLNTNDLIQQLKQIQDITLLIDYDSFLESLKVSSSEYQDISDSPYIRYCSTDQPIPSVIFALFATRIPVLFDLIINQDLFQLQRELQSNNYENYKNIYLLLFRLSDREPYYNTQGHGEISKNNIYTELSRIVLSMSLKKIISKLFEGTVTSPLVSPVLNIFKNLVVKNVKTYQEMLLSCILKIWSFKPTVVLKNITSDFRTETVFFVEYDISGYNQFDNQNIKFNQELLKYMYYDQINNKVILSPKFMLDSLSGNMSNIPNVQPPITYCNTGLYRNIPTLTNIALRSTGVFILSIPRLIKRTLSFNLPDEFNDRMTTRYVDLDQNITIGNNLFQLRSAVCYKISKVIDLETCTQNPSTLGTVAIVRTQKGWIRYNPNLMQSFSEKRDILESLRKIEFTKYNIDNNIEFNQEEFEEWKRVYSNMDRITDKFNRGFIDIDALIIPESEAIDTISRYGTLIIYAQEYSGLYDMSPLRRC